MTPVSDQCATSATSALSSLLRADFTVLTRNRRALILGTAVPLVILFAIPNNPKRVSAFGNKDFLIATCLTLGLAATAIIGYSMSVARDREKGIFQRLRITPVPTWTIMTSRLLVQLVASAAMAVIVLIAATVKGVDLSAAAYVLTVMLTTVCACVYLSIGQALVGLVRSADTLNALTRIVYIAIYVVGVLGNSGALGDTVRDIARWSPYGVVTSILGAAVKPTTWDATTSWSFIVAVAYSIAFAGVGIKWFKWTSS